MIRKKTFEILELFFDDLASMDWNEATTKWKLPGLCWLSWAASRTSLRSWNNDRLLDVLRTGDEVRHSLLTYLTNHYQRHWQRSRFESWLTWDAAEWVHYRFQIGEPGFESDWKFFVADSARRRRRNSSAFFKVSLAVVGVDPSPPYGQVPPPPTHTHPEVRVAIIILSIQSQSHLTFSSQQQLLQPRLKNSGPTISSSRASFSLKFRSRWSMERPSRNFKEGPGDYSYRLSIVFQASLNKIG